MTEGRAEGVRDSEGKAKRGKERDEGRMEGERLHTKFHLSVFAVSASGGQKPQFGANFDIRETPIPNSSYR